MRKRIVWFTGALILLATVAASSVAAVEGARALRTRAWGRATTENRPAFTWSRRSRSRARATTRRAPPCPTLRRSTWWIRTERTCAG